MLSKISLKHFTATSLNNFLPKKIDFSSVCSILPNQFVINPINNFDMKFQRFFSQSTTKSKIEILKEKADSGDRDAQYELGSYYLSSENKKIPDNEKGVHYIKLAAENNHPTACYMYSSYLKNGFHVKKDLDEALKYLTYAADHNLEIAQFELGLEYYTGKRFPSDNSKALHYFCLSAENGNVTSCETVGTFYIQGIGCKPDLKLAIKYLELGSKLNSSICKYQLSVIKSIDNKEESIRLLKEAADLGFVIAQHEYSKYLLLQKKDEKEAEKYLRLAANQNDSQSCLELSEILKSSGNAIKKREAFLFLKKSADLENEKAMVQLGRLLCGEKDISYGVQITTDLNLALKYLKKAADQSNNPEASFEYASRLGDFLNMPNSSSTLDVNHVENECIEFYKKGMENANQFHIMKSQYLISYANFLMSRGKKVNAYFNVYHYLDLKDPAFYYTAAVVECQDNQPRAINLIKQVILLLFPHSLDHEIKNLVYQDFLFSPNLVNSFNILKSKVEENHSNVTHKLIMSLLISIGAGTDLNVSKALDTIKELANNDNNLAAKIYSAWLINNIDGKQKDINKLIDAVEICKKVADKNDADMQFLYGKLKVYGNWFAEADVEEGIRYLEKAAPQCSEAAFLLGSLYFNGNVVKPNVEEAKKYLEMAAEFGHEQAKEAMEKVQSASD